MIRLFADQHHVLIVSAGEVEWEGVQRVVQNETISNDVK